MKCPVCNHETEVRRADYTSPYKTHDGESIVVKQSPFRKCLNSECGETMLTSNMLSHINSIIFKRILEDRNKLMKTTEELGWQYEELMERRQEIRNLKKAIRLLGSMAGNPDAKEGCRLIVKNVNELLGDEEL